MPLVMNVQVLGTQTVLHAKAVIIQVVEHALPVIQNAIHVRVEQILSAKAVIQDFIYHQQHVPQLAQQENILNHQIILVPLAMLRALLVLALRIFCVFLVLLVNI